MRPCPIPQEMPFLLSFLHSISTQESTLFVGGVSVLAITCPRVHTHPHTHTHSITHIIYMFTYTLTCAWHQGTGFTLGPVSGSSLQPQPLGSCLAHNNCLIKVYWSKPSSSKRTQEGLSLRPRPHLSKGKVSPTELLPKQILFFICVYILLGLQFQFDVYCNLFPVTLAPTEC